MMKPFVAVFSLILCTCLDAQKGKLFLSSWHENENAQVNVQSYKYSYFEKGKLYYFLSNDNDNIYIDMNIEDPGVQSRILKQGLTVWINMDNKQAKKLGIRFPIGSQYSGGRNKPNMPEVKINEDGSLVTPLSLANTIELIGFINEEARRFPADNADNFRGSVKFNNEGSMHYKLVMPVAKLPVRNSKDGDGAMPFTYGIEYGALPLMNSPRGNMAAPPSSSGGSRGGSQGGGRPRGGVSGGRGAGSGNPGSVSIASQNSVPPVLLWIKNIKLASDK